MNRHRRQVLLLVGIASLGTCALAAARSTAGAGVAEGQRGRRGQRSQQDTPPAAVARTIRGFFQGIAARDAAAAMATWSPESPHTETIRASVPEAIRYLAAKPISQLRITDCKIDGKTATAYVSFRGKWSASEEVYTDEPETVWLVSLVRTAGGWRITNAQHRFVEILTLLDQADTPAQRAELYRAHPKLAGLRLRLLMTRLGDRYRDESQNGLAKKCFTIAVELAERQKDSLALCENLFYLGTMCWPILSQPAEAISHFERALALAQQIGNTGFEILIRNGLGASLGDLGEEERGLAHLHRSLALSETVDPMQGRSTTENLIGFVHTRFGRTDQAVRWYRRSLETARGTGAVDQQLHAFAHLSTALRDLGELGPALDITSQGLALCKKHPDPLSEAKLRNTLGLIYQDTDRHEESIPEFVFAVREFSRGGLGQLASIALANLGHSSFQLDRFAEALESYTSALEIATSLEHATMAVASTHLKLGVIHRQLGKFREARKHYAQARALSQKQGFLEGEISALCNQAELDFSQGRVDVALRGFAAARERAARGGVPSSRFQCDIGLGRTLVHRGKPGDLTRAVTALRAAFAYLEKSRSSLEDPMLKVGFFSNFAGWATDLIDALIRLDRPAQAFAVAEQIKARAIVEMLRAGQVQVTKAMSTADREREDLLRRRATALHRQLERTFLTDAREELQAKIERVEKERETFRREVFRRRPRLQTLRARFTPATPAQVQERIFARHPKAAIVSFVVGRDHLDAFVLRAGDRSARLTTRRSPCGERALNALVLRFWSACADSAPDYRQHAKALYQPLFEALRADLAGCDHLIVIPDGSLHAVPFAALVDGQGTHLIERYSLSVAPSVTALIETCSRPAGVGPKRNPDEHPAATAPPRLVLALGAPQMPAPFADLPYAERELARIAKRYDVRPQTGAAATETRARAALTSPVRILHLATHGKLNPQRPMDSFLVFGADSDHDGRLHAREIAGLDLHADLAILSACETGRGREVRGEGVVGLTWSLLVAGVPAQLVSHWQIHDEATCELMDAFHAALDARPTGALPTAAALATAQRRMLASEERGHPYFWASFYAVGRWN